ncbi:MAG TPA: branched-chain amino acid ABC transporter permease [Stellaceae bacterium]|nr:branched-chain amino acid ABC transporter permease [Stellaceae bacterium]
MVAPSPLVRALLLVGLAALALYPLVGSAFYLQLLAKIMILAIFAMSLDLLVGFAGLVSLGHAAFFGVGAYALMLLSPDYAAASLWLSLPIAIAAAAIAALVIGALVLRTSGVYFIMVTLAFAQMLFYFAIKSRALGGSDGAYIYVKPDATILGWRPFDLGNRVHFYYVALALMVATYVLLRTVLRSLFGHVIQGIRANEPRMRALGYPAFRYKLAAFVLAGALAGLAGYLSAAQYGYVNPELFGWQESGSVLMMVILGGIGTLFGPILGAFVLTLLQDFLSDEAIFHGFHKHWLLPMGIFVVLAVLLLPRGIGGLALGPRRSAVEATDD